MMSNQEIEHGGTSLNAMLATERRRRGEAAQAEGLEPLAALLLPLSLSLARLAARRDVTECVQ